MRVQEGAKVSGRACALYGESPRFNSVDWRIDNRKGKTLSAQDNAEQLGKSMLGKMHLGPSASYVPLLVLQPT